MGYLKDIFGGLIVINPNNKDVFNFIPKFQNLLLAYLNLAPLDDFILSLTILLKKSVN